MKRTILTLIATLMVITEHAQVPESERVLETARRVNAYFVQKHLARRRQ